MSLHISFEDFEKIANKECLKRTGLCIKDFPTIWLEDYWPNHSLTETDLQAAKEAIDTCIEDVINTLQG
jgi:hypothetical protein